MAAASASQRRCFTRKLEGQHRKHRHADHKVESYRVQIRRYCGARVLLCCRIRRGRFVVERTRYKPPRANLRPVDSMNGLQESLKGPDAVGDEMGVELKALVEQCSTPLRNRTEENDKGC